MDSDELRNRFMYHPADSEGKRIAHEQARGIALRAAQELNDLVPEGREKSLVMTHLEEAMFWANAAIARGYATPKGTEIPGTSPSMVSTLDGDHLIIDHPV